MLRPRRGLAPATLLTFLSFLACERAPEIHVRSGFVMGTVAELKIVSDDATAALAALDRGLAELARIEALTTTHSDSSEVARLSRTSGEWAANVDPDVSGILALATRIAARSDGAFDPTAGPLIATWGFPEEPALPDSAALVAALAAVVWQRLEPGALPDGASGPPVEWMLGAAGMTLDLGGIAKGWGVDRAVDVLAGLSGACLVNAGGDLAVRGTKPDGRGWLIGVQDPRDPSQLFLRLRVSGEVAVATSGDYQRFFEADGVRYHHLLDPRTGWPAREVRSATVIAPSCALADAWATAAFVLGPEAGRAALESEPGIEGVLVTVDDAGELVLHETTGFSKYRA